ncbi:cytochrome c [Desulfuromonas carbonis]|uniref:hypothetical protein n=1 Tax=Desulfuromonas sp. DDH964 TaxID=1823759 RepID=UPI00078B53BC|nr:hypothetical protein [Desulfuromonas sp. DDH964]AMV72783.1 putative extracellular tetraheme cytochrome c [Desulfuromonas sp. DDH964]
MVYLKKILLYGLGCLGGGLLVLGTADAAQKLSAGTGGVNDHPHNLSSNSQSAIHATSNENVQQVCVFCHTPHGASTKGPLWNRNDPTRPSGGFPLYGNLAAISIDEIPAAKYTNTDPTIEYPNGASRLCLSCHDGVSAVGEVISRGTIANLTMSAQGTIDLTTSHPISFVYDGTVQGTLSAVVGKGNYIEPPIEYLDKEKRMQCTTCHDPHNDTRNASYDLPMWAHYTNDASAVSDYDTTCNACHGPAFSSGGLPAGGGVGAGHNTF